MSIFEGLGQMHESATAAHAKADRIIEELDKQTRWLAHLSDRIRTEEDNATFTRIPAQGTADATGVCTIELDLSPGIGFELVSIAASAPSADGGCFLYLSTNDPVNLIRVLDYGPRMSDDFAGGEYVNSGQKIIVEFTGQTPGDNCTINLRVKVRR